MKLPNAIQRIESYLSGVGEGRFRQELLIQDGVIRRLEIIGEAAKRLSSKLRQRCREMPWRTHVGQPVRR